MDKKIKIWNRTKGMHTFVYSDGHKQVPIAPNGFQLVPVEEIYYVDQTSKSFKKGILEIDPSETELNIELGYAERNANVYTPQEIEKLLSGNLTKQVKEQLSTMSEPHAFDKLIEVARKMDLPQSKIKFIEELTGMKVLHELIEFGEQKD